MTISPNRSSLFHGTDPVAHAVRTSISAGTTSRSSRNDAAAPRAAAQLDLQALYPALFPPAPVVRNIWSLRRLVLQR